MKISHIFDKDTLSYFTFCIIAIFVYVKSNSIVASSTISIVTSSTIFPKLLSFSLFLLNALLIINHLYKKNKNGKEKDIKSSWKNLFNFEKYTTTPIITFFVCCIFVYIYPRIGFELSSFLLVFTIMYLINRKEAIKKFYYAIISPLLFLILFKFGLNLTIPLTIDILFKK